MQQDRQQAKLGPIRTFSGSIGRSIPAGPKDRRPESFSLWINMLILLLRTPAHRSIPEDDDAPCSARTGAQYILPIDRPAGGKSDWAHAEGPSTNRARSHRNISKGFMHLTCTPMQASGILILRRLAAGTSWVTTVCPPA